MQVTMNIDTKAVITAISTNELVSHIESRSDKFDILEAFSNNEIINYVTDNKVIDEEVISFMIDAGKISLERLLGKVANLQFQKNFQEALKSIDTKTSV